MRYASERSAADVHAPFYALQSDQAPAGLRVCEPPASPPPAEPGACAGWYWQADSRLRITHLFGGCVARCALGRMPWEVPGVDMFHRGWVELFDAMLTRQPFIDVVWRRRDRLGRLHHCLISGEPVFSPKRRFVGYRGVGRQIDIPPPA